jgi:hypothetical protein
MDLGRAEGTGGDHWFCVKMSGQSINERVDLTYLGSKNVLSADIASSQLKVAGA